MGIPIHIMVMGLWLRDLHKRNMRMNWRSQVCRLLNWMRGLKRWSWVLGREKRWDGGMRNLDEIIAAVAG